MWRPTAHHRGRSHFRFAFSLSRRAVCRVPPAIVHHLHHFALHCQVWPQPPAVYAAAPAPMRKTVVEIPHNVTASGHLALTCRQPPGKIDRVSAPIHLRALPLSVAVSFNPFFCIGPSASGVRGNGRSCQISEISLTVAGTSPPVVR